MSNTRDIIDDLLEMPDLFSWVLQFTRKLNGQEKEVVWQKIWILYHSTSNGRPHAFNRLFATVLNSCCDQRCSEFLLSRPILEKLLQNDQNAVRKSLSGSQFKAFISRAIEVGMLEMLEAPSSFTANAKVKKAGRYKLLYGMVLDFIATKQVDSSSDSSTVNFDLAEIGDSSSDSSSDSSTTHTHTHTPTYTSTPTRKMVEEEIYKEQEPRKEEHNDSLVRSVSLVEKDSSSTLDKMLDFLLDQKDKLDSWTLDFVIQREQERSVGPLKLSDKQIQKLKAKYDLIFAKSTASDQSFLDKNYVPAWLDSVPIADTSAFKNSNVSKSDPDALFAELGGPKDD